jgi:hypothetical protein
MTKEELKYKIKALELIVSFQEIGLTKEQAKQCALICVDEIIETFIPKNNKKYKCDEIDYWQQVKTEIEKL